MQIKMYRNTRPYGSTTGNSNVREKHFYFNGGDDVQEARNCTILRKNKVILTKCIFSIQRR